MYPCYENLPKACEQISLHALQLKTRAPLFYRSHPRRGDTLHQAKQRVYIFVVLLVLFRQRLRLRGFLAKFLAEAFKSAPKYNNRLTLVAPRGPKNESPVIVFSTVFSRMKHEAKLSRAIFLNRHMLPSRFDAVKFILSRNLM